MRHYLATTLRAFRLEESLNEASHRLILDRAVLTRVAERTAHIFPMSKRELSQLFRDVEISVLKADPPWVPSATTRGD